jgi:putative transcriptional regulator
VPPAPHWTAVRRAVKNSVRTRRTDAELSQSELAVRMGVSRQTINSLENGRYLPSLPLAINLARFFGTTVEQLFELEREETR